MAATANDRPKTGGRVPGLPEFSPLQAFDRIAATRNEAAVARAMFDRYIGRRVGECPLHPGAQRVIGRTHEGHVHIGCRLVKKSSGEKVMKCVRAFPIEYTGLAWPIDRTQVVYPDGSFNAALATLRNVVIAWVLAGGCPAAWESKLGQARPGPVLAFGGTVVFPDGRLVYPTDLGIVPNEAQVAEYEAFLGRSRAAESQSGIPERDPVDEPAEPEQVRFVIRKKAVRP